MHAHHVTPAAPVSQLQIAADLRDLVISRQQEPPSQLETMTNAFRQAAHRRQRS
ncbi:hypothetical protein [Ktedonobacter sp. SOSP1-52]|uniref:hypothetical protein n=1 Tax=Ktedonobacter sp. SOSP1-52 TaxID=2778366 RepID=UPI0019161929|nr:hypothetical protein [Ktedonobacter sp. SOSP1-52]